ncbi:threonine/homoserine/homoserine lactone efflux protein [Pseudomonas duriflava]|uniref:Threonine/homoserine/homoserine lactone efflux protein n=1 Tax=Pseudomonas duriflava TaxID=459528 RepID=A0A562Q769_9PSED|nr:LysE family transporter [Pseudomonas duriflava]TWI52554.1 threonine/homoserine/homoserine lactone efflux protein [Pseudomonas duriflava]
MFSSYMTEFLSLAIIHFLAVIAPGPDFAVTVRQSVRFGRLVGLFTALGIGAGISIHVLYTLLGIGALMHAWPWLLGIAKLAGGAYILYLGISLIKSKASPPTSEVAPNAFHTEQPTFGKAFLVGFLTNATNPKATLFFLAIFTTLVSSETPIHVQALYGLWMCSVNAAWFMLVGLLFSSPYIRAAFLRLGHWFERTMGLVLVFFAGRLLLSTF